jgi:hypothetical protein
VAVVAARKVRRVRKVFRERVAMSVVMVRKVFKVQPDPDHKARLVRKDPQVRREQQVLKAPQAHRV